MKSLLNKLRTSLLLMPALVMGLSFVTPAVAHAADCSTDNLSAASGADCAQGNNTPTNLFNGDDSVFKRVVNIMLFIVGAVAVIMLIFGGVRYVTSGGAQDQVTAAKNTIMYAIIGIVVAILAYAVVNFVISGVSTT